MKWIALALTLLATNACAGIYYDLQQGASSATMKLGGVLKLGTTTSGTPSIVANGLDGSLSANGVRVATQFAGANLGAQVNAALADFGAAPSCGEILIPAGTYNFSTPINWGQRQGCWIHGNGMGATSLIYTGVASTGAFNNGGGDPALGIGQLLKLTDFNMTCSGTGCSADAIRIVNGTRYDIANIYIQGSYNTGSYPIHLVSNGSINTYLVSIHDNQITFNTGGAGIRLDGTNTGDSAAIINIFHNGLKSNGIGVWAAKASETVNIYGNELQGNTTGLMLDGGYSTNIYGNYFEITAGAPYQNIIIGTVTAANSVTITGNQISGGEYCVKLDGGVIHNDVQIYGNFCKNATHGYYLNKLSNGRVGPNSGGSQDIVTVGLTSATFTDANGNVFISTPPVSTIRGTLTVANGIEVQSNNNGSGGSFMTYKNRANGAIWDMFPVTNNSVLAAGTDLELEEGSVGSHVYYQSGGNTGFGAGNTAPISTVSVAGSFDWGAGSTKSTGSSNGSLALATPLVVGSGGTGSTTASGARGNLSAAASGANADITSLSALATISNPYTATSSMTNTSAGGIKVTNTAALGFVTVTSTTNIANESSLYTSQGVTGSLTTSFSLCTTTKTITTTGGNVFINFDTDGKNGAIDGWCAVWFLQDGQFINSATASLSNVASREATAAADAFSMSYHQPVSAAPAAGSHSYCFGVASLSVGNTCTLGLQAFTAFSVLEIK